MFQRERRSNKPASAGGFRRRYLRFMNSGTSCLRPLSLATLAKPIPGFTVPLPCFFPVCLVGALQIPSGAIKRDQANGTVSNGDLLSEISSGLATGVLDRTSAACHRRGYRDGKDSEAETQKAFGLTLDFRECGSKKFSAAPGLSILVKNCQCDDVIVRTSFASFSNASRFSSA